MCTVAFHVPCLRKQSFQKGIRDPDSDLDEDDEALQDPLAFMGWAYCEKHLPVCAITCLNI